MWHQVPSPLSERQAVILVTVFSAREELIRQGSLFKDDLEGSPNSGSQGSKKVTFEVKMMRYYQKPKKSPPMP